LSLLALCSATKPLKDPKPYKETEWRPGIDLLLPGRIPGRRRDRRLTTDALAQALDLWSQAFACQLLLEPHNLVRVRLSPQLFQMLLVPDACLRWVHGFDRLRRPLR